MKRCISAGSVLCVLLLGGCGGGSSDLVDTVPVSGTLYVDGQPYGPASLGLHPVRSGQDDKRVPASASVGADGKFTVTTYETGDGVAPGEYEVALTKGGKAGSTDPAEMMTAMQSIPVKYKTITIPPDGTDTLEVQLESDDPPKESAPGALLGR